MKKQNDNGYISLLLPPNVTNYCFPNLFSFVLNHEAMEIRHGPTVGWIVGSTGVGGALCFGGSLAAENGGCSFSGGRGGTWRFHRKRDWMRLECCSFRFGKAQNHRSQSRKDDDDDDDDKNDVERVAHMKHNLFKETPSKKNKTPLFP